MSELPPIHELKEKVAAKQREMNAPKDSGPGHNTAGYAAAMRYALDLVANVGVGGAIGYFIDQWAGTMPVVFILCLILGMASGVYALHKHSQRQIDG